MSAEVPPRCLVCTKRPGFRRGCCHACYSRHAADVAAGRTTWTDLVTRGLALPRAPRTLGAARWRENQ